MTLWWGEGRGIIGRIDLRHRLRAGSIFFAVFLVFVSLLPVIVLSCAGVTMEDTRPKERLTFATQPKVRVVLAINTRGGVTLPIGVSGGYSILDPTTMTTVLRGPRLQASPVQALSNGIVMTIADAGGSKRTVRLPRMRIVPVKSGTLRVGGRSYRGVLDIVYSGEGTMTLVNELDLEEYIGGVVAAEAPHDWPNETLRAQAVVARTYALALVMENEKLHPRPEWDFEASYLTAQEYQGLSGEHPRALEAVQATRGMVLVHDGNVFRAYFSSCCGGHTEACGVCWDDYPTIPPLVGKTCDYCKNSKWYNWKTVLSLTEIERALRRAGKDVGSVSDVRFADTTGDGHVDRVSIRGSKGTLDMSGNDFRLAVGSMNLRSMMFVSRRVGDGIEFTGHGWGHGVGMCQYGARNMAEVLLTYDRILTYYYPETELWKVY